VQCLGTILRVNSAADSTMAEMRAGLHRLAQLCFRPPPPPPPPPPQDLSLRTACAPQHQQQRRVVVLRSAAPYIAGGGWLPELVRMTGSVCTFTFPGEGAMAVEWSDIAAQDPDVIIIAVEIVGLEAAALELSVLAEEAGWWSLRATRNREVYVVDAAHLLQIGPGVVHAAQTVARMCRPDLRDELGDSAAARRDGAATVLKLQMTASQRCRPSLLPSFLKPVPW
jgi:hypothetical protein